MRPLHVTLRCALLLASQPSPLFSMSSRSLEQPLLRERKSTAAQLIFEQTTVQHKTDEMASAGVWENQDDGSREATDIGFGVKFLKHFNNAHADKILEYETRELESKPWAIILEETRRASVLVMPHVLRSILYCSVLAVTFMGVSLLLEEEVDCDHLRQLGCLRWTLLSPRAVRWALHHTMVADEDRISRWHVGSHRGPEYVRSCLVSLGVER